MLRKAVLVFAATFLMWGCSADAARDPVPAATVAPSSVSATSVTTPARLNDSSWRFVEVAGAPVPATVTATMRLRDGRAGGRAGCNSYGATYRIEPDGSASFQPGMSTKMACLEPEGAMRVERGIFAAFRGTAKVEIRDGDLVLLDANGMPLARLVRASAQ